MMLSLRTSIILIVMTGALIFLQYRLWFQDGGIRDMLKLRKLLEMQLVENGKLKQRNDELLFQIQRIQNSRDATEARARGELGMVKKGETFYQVIK